MDSDRKRLRVSRVGSGPAERYLLVLETPDGDLMRGWVGSAIVGNVACGENAIRAMMAALEASHPVDVVFEDEQVTGL